MTGRRTLLLLCRYLVTDPDAWTSKLFASLLTPFTKSPEQGAQTSIYLASSPEVEGMSEKYYIDCKRTTASSAAYKLDDARKLWEMSEELTAAKAPATAAVTV